MDLTPPDDLESLIPPKEREKRKDRLNQLRQSLDLLKKRIEADHTEVTQDEIIQGMGNCFELNSSSDFLEDTPWLIKALRFTSRPICNEEIPIAWIRFLDDELSEEAIFVLADDWPILECIAGWYISHLGEAGYNDSDMVRRALAVLEYLIQILYGEDESKESYREVLTGNGLSILYGYCGLKDFERAKFYAQLLRMEYLAGRLDSEDYREVKENYDHILNLEHKDRASNDTILKLQWETISDREKRIKELENRVNQIIEQNSNKPDLEKAEKELKAKFGLTWNAVHAETQRHLALARAFAHPSISNEHPYVTPWSLFKAINSELFAKLFVPDGTLDKEILEENHVSSPVTLLIHYRELRFYYDKPATNSIIKKALSQIVGGKDRILTDNDIKHLKILRHNRNYEEHSKHPYTKEEMQKLLQDVWRDNWLLNWLQRINQKF